MSRGAVKVAPTTTKFTCPWCGVNAGSEYLLQINHWVDLEREGEDPEGKPFYYPRAKGGCFPQIVIASHVSFRAKALRDGQSSVYTTGRSGKFDRAGARAALADSIVEATKYGVDHAGIIAGVLATTECTRCRAGEHDDCFEDLTWSDITDDVVSCACWGRAHEAAS